MRKGSRKLGRYTSVSEKLTDTPRREIVGLYAIEITGRDPAFSTKHFFDGWRTCRLWKRSAAHIRTRAFARRRWKRSAANSTRAFRRCRRRWKRSTAHSMRAFNLLKRSASHYTRAFLAEKGRHGEFYLIWLCCEKRMRREGRARPKISIRCYIE